MEEDIPDEATVGTKASDDVETANTSKIFLLIFESVLNSSIPQPKTKTLTHDNSPTQPFEHTPSPEHDMVLPLGPVMSSPKPYDDSDSYTIAHILRTFHTSYDICVLSRHLYGEFYELPTLLNTIIEPDHPINISNNFNKIIPSSSSISSSSSNSEESKFNPINAIPIQAIPLETVPFEPQ